MAARIFISALAVAGSAYGKQVINETIKSDKM